MRFIFGVALACAQFGVLPLLAGPAADAARAIRENGFDRDECYRVRDVSLVREDIRIYLTAGHLMFSKPVAGRRIAALFAGDVEGGDGEVILMPPDRAERRSLAAYTSAPNLDEHFHAGLFLFTGDDYDRIRKQLADSDFNKKTPEVGALLEPEWTPVLQNLGASYVTRLVFDLLDQRRSNAGLFIAMFLNPRIGNFDVSFDSWNPEQILAGQLTTRENRSFFDVWTSFPARSSRENPKPKTDELLLRDCRIDATINPDLSLSAVTRLKVKAVDHDLVVAPFDIATEMQVTEVNVDGKPAEALQRDSLRLNMVRGGNSLFLVVPPEPLKAGREYEFEFHHSGKVIHDAGDRVFYVSARGNWYPIHGSQYITFDLRFRYPHDLELVTAGDVVEDRTEGDWRITRRRTSTPIRMMAFNLGNYAHSRLERGGYVVDVCANRSLERALETHPQPPLPPPANPRPRRPDLLSERPLAPPEPNPLERMHTLAEEVASSLEFMAAHFGPPALPHLSVTPVPGTFGQGFPGLIFLSTLSYLKNLPDSRSRISEVQNIFYQDMLEAHETAHQWWGNRVTAATYRDYWLMEALANYSALLYLEKNKSPHVMDTMLDSYRMELLSKSESGQTVDSAGPIVLGWRLSSSQEPRGWRTITYGKGSWLLHMLRERMGTERFMSMLTAMIQRYDGKEITTEEFRDLAAQFLPPKSDDPKLESFFEQWVYGTGIPGLKLSYSVRGRAGALRVVGTITQSDVDEDFSTLVPVEIQVARGKPITRWVRTGSTPATFTVGVAQAPSKVLLDPRRAILRR